MVAISFFVIFVGFRVAWNKFSKATVFEVSFQTFVSIPWMQFCSVYSSY